MAVISFSFFLAFSILVYDKDGVKNNSVVVLIMLALDLSFWMISNAIFNFKYWTISVLLE